MSSLAKSYRRVRSVGIVTAAATAARRLTGLSAPRGLAVFLSRFDNLRTIEIGGPSGPFMRRGIFPVYGRIRACDNVNFASSTLWTGPTGCREVYAPEGRLLGRNLIGEAASLGTIPDAEYDSLLASHVLEHTANPIRALLEWKRILKSPGVMALIVPDGRRTFDHSRAVTPLSHLKTDYLNNTGEDDSTHFEEVLAKHDMKRDPELGSREELISRARSNLELRSIHHHVFSRDSLIALLQELGLTVDFSALAQPFHIIAVVRTQ